MNRNFLTLGEQFASADFCNNAKNGYVGLANLAQTVLGSNTLLNGFTCTPNSPANLSVNVSAGNIYQLAVTDSTTFGALPVDSHQIYKQGINQDSMSLTFTAPATPGQSINYLIEATLQEADGVSQNRQFYNAASEVVNTVRADTVYIKSLAGAAATTGSQVTPTPETGFVGAFVVTVAYNQTQITSDNIQVYDATKFITEKLQDKISQTTADARYARFIQVPPTRSIIIGGNLTNNPWTYGTNFPAIANGAFAANRFMYRKSGAMVHTASKVASAPSFAQAGYILSDCLNLACTTADTSLSASDFCAWTYIVEGFDFAEIAQQAAILQFWVYATVTGVYCVSFTNSGKDYSFISEYTVNASNTWQLVTIPIPASPSSGTWDYRLGAGLKINFVLAAGSNSIGTAGSWQAGSAIATASQVNACSSTSNVFRIARVDLGDANAINGFDDGGVANTVLRCSRYVQRYDCGIHGIAAGGSNPNVGIDFSWYYYNPMRTTPTVTLLNTTVSLVAQATVGAITGASITSGGSSINCATILIVGSSSISLPSGAPVYINSNADNILQVENELTY